MVATAGLRIVGQARLRAQTLLERTRAEFGDSQERVAYVMHADIKLLLIQQFHVDPLEFPANTSVTRVRISRERTQLEYYNFVEHLPDAAITH